MRKLKPPVPLEFEGRTYYSLTLRVYLTPEEWDALDTLITLANAQEEGQSPVLTITDVARAVFCRGLQAYQEEGVSDLQPSPEATC